MNTAIYNETKPIKVLMAEDEEDILRSIKLMIRLIPQRRGHAGGLGGKE